LSGAARLPVARFEERIGNMTTPVKVDVDNTTKDTLGALARGDPDDLLAAGLEMRAKVEAASRLDGRTFALVKIASLIALDAPPASYIWQIGMALQEGATPEDILGVLIAIAPQVGGPRLVAAAPEIMVALGLTLPDDM
jgi:alkylhydroperoxidase/carboxymuconolactone decarboxylase family protein YurZ